MKKLDKPQIEALYKFTRQHYVEYYDVQTELVDHLANGIEAQWQKDPEVSFDEALKTEFKKFGVFGFSEILEKRERAMEKKYFGLIWKEAKDLLKQPKWILLLVLSCSATYLLLSFQVGVYALMALIVVLFLLSAIYVGRKNSNLKKKMKSGKKVFLLERLILNTGGYFSIMWIPIHIFNLTDISVNPYVVLPMSLFVVFLILCTYICFYHLPEKKDEILKKAHPEIKFLQ